MHESALLHLGKRGLVAVRARLLCLGPIQKLAQSIFERSRGRYLKHLGKPAKVCGVVADIAFAKSAADRYIRSAMKVIHDMLDNFQNRY
jgi:hypothetical protein